MEKGSLDDQLFDVLEKLCRGQKMRPKDAYRLMVGRKWQTYDEEDKKILIQIVNQLIDKVVQSSRSCIFFLKKMGFNQL